MRTEDGYIVYRCLNGESQAFGSLVDKYRDRVYALAYSRLRNFHDAQDITQDAFIRAYEKLHTLRRWDRFQAWIYSITSNLCKNHIRIKDRRPDGDFVEEQDAGFLNRVCTEDHRRRMRLQSVHDILDALPEPHRQVLSLYHLAGMSSVEIAEFLGISPSSVRKRLSRARARLRVEELETAIEIIEDQKLPASFTLRIMETVKHTQINPAPRITGLRWGIISALGTILVVLNISSHLSLLNPTHATARSTIPRETTTVSMEWLSVDLLEIPSLPSTSYQQDNGVSESPVFSGISRFPGYAQEIYTNGGYAYVTDPRGRFHVFDVSDPENPGLLGSCKTPGGARALYVNGKYAYVSNTDYDGDVKRENPELVDYRTGLSIIDISDPAAPHEVGFCSTSMAFDIHVVGNYAYVADGNESGLRIIDVSDPSHPREVGRYYTSQYAIGVYVVGNYAYLANGSDGLRVIDVSDPTKPRCLGRYGTQWAHQVQVVGNYAYLTDIEGLYVIDVSDPMNLRKAGFCSTPDAALGIQVVGKYAYIANRSDGLRLIDVSNPSSPKEIGYYDESQLAYGVHVDGDLVYLADTRCGLLIIETMIIEMSKNLSAKSGV